MAHEGLPVAGYTRQPDSAVERVNENKRTEEMVLRVLDGLQNSYASVDHRWLAVARTHIEQGFMAMNRAIFRPQRVELSDGA